jgi:hypothetical protein
VRALSRLSSGFGVVVVCTVLWSDLDVVLRLLGRLVLVVVELVSVVEVCVVVTGKEVVTTEFSVAASVGFGVVSVVRRVGKVVVGVAAVVVVVVVVAVVVAVVVGATVVVVVVVGEAFVVTSGLVAVEFKTFTLLRRPPCLRLRAGLT